MSMMYPNGQGIPAASQFMTGGQPNYGAPLVNFGAQFNQGRQAMQPAPQPQQLGGQPNAPNPNGTGKGPGQSNMMKPGDFAAKLRAFFTPGGGAQPGAQPPQGNPAGFGPGDMAGQNPASGMAPGGGVGFGGGGPQQMPPMNFGGGSGF